MQQGGSLDFLDRILMQRVNTSSLSILAQDYSETSTCPNKNCRLLGMSWVGPWGGSVPWLLTPTSITTTDKDTTKIILRLPQSRIRHFLSDGSLFLKSICDNYRITRAILRLGPDHVLQSMDSEFACKVSLIYKRGIRLQDSIRYNTNEKSLILVTPLLLEAPLRVLPLYIPNMPLPEIEYEVSSSSKDAVVVKPPLTEDSVNVITEFISSNGEIEQMSEVLQYLPTFTTFTSSETFTFTEASTKTITVNVSCPEKKLARCLYIRVFDKEREDISDIITAIDVRGGERLQTLLGVPLPGSICRHHLKSKFGFAAGDKATRLPYTELPYYTIPFAVNPAGQNADYGVSLVEGSEVNVTVTTQGPLKDFAVQVVVETANRVIWNANASTTKV